MYVILGTWANRDGPAASTWLMEQYEGTGRTAMFRAVAQAWGRSQPNLTKGWVLSLGDPAERDQGLLGLMSALNVISPEREELAGMLQLEESLQTEKRDRLMELIRVDPASAEAMLDEVELDEETLESVKKQIEEAQKARQWEGGQRY